MIGRIIGKQDSQVTNFGDQIDAAIVLRKLCNNEITRSIINKKSKRYGTIKLVCGCNLRNAVQEGYKSNR